MKLKETANLNNLHGTNVLPQNSDENNRIIRVKNSANEHSDDHNDKHSAKTVDQGSNMNIASEYHNNDDGDDNRGGGDKLPSTFNGMKSKYLELKARFDNLFKNYSELSEEYAVLMHKYENGTNIHKLRQDNKTWDDLSSR